MSTTVRNYCHLFRVRFVFQTIGDIFLSLTSFASVVTQYIYGTSPQQTTQDVEAFTAETRSLLFLNPNIVAFSEREFQEFHDFTLSCGQPMGTVLVSERVKCRKCDKPLVLEKTSHPVVIYHRISWDLHGEPPNQTLSNMPDTRTLRPMVNPRSKVLGAANN